MLGFLAPTGALNRMQGETKSDPSSQARLACKIHRLRAQEKHKRSFCFLGMKMLFILLPD